MTGAQATMLPDGRRLHLNHGPIDLIVEAFGPEAERQAAYRAAVARFRTILEELVAELPRLRRPLMPGDPPFAGRTARRMARAVWPHRAVFVTPMAAVAGAVADEVLAALVRGRRLSRAYVNDGGDIALWLAPGASLTAAIAGTGGADGLGIRHADPVRGIATSGWRGRSHSLGIADAVTATARSAAAADVAATLVANAVDLPGHPVIARVPARQLDPDSDLGDRLVTTRVGPLSEAEIAVALDAGAARARALVGAGLVEGAALFLAGASRLVSRSPALEDAHA